MGALNRRIRDKENKERVRRVEMVEPTSNNRRSLKGKPETKRKGVGAFRFHAQDFNGKWENISSCNVSYLGISPRTLGADAERTFQSTVCFNSCRLVRITEC